MFLVREFSRYTNHTLIIITKKTIHHFLRIISSKSFLHLDILVAQLIESENLQFLVTSHDGNSIRPFIRKEGNVLFNDALNTFYLRLYGVRHMVKDHFDSEKGNPLPPHRLLFPINSKGSFICTIPDRIVHTTAFVTPVVEHWLEREIAQWVHPMKDRSNDPSQHKRTLLPRSYISLPPFINASPLCVNFRSSVLFPLTVK